MDKLEALFKDKASKVFGSGWVWLVWYACLSLCWCVCVSVCLCVSICLFGMCMRSVCAPVRA
jgi:hypothetical protein